MEGKYYPEVGPEVRPSRPGVEVTRDVTLQATLAPLTGRKVSLPSPLTGRITQVLFHWPAGCLALVDIAFGHEDTWVLPSAVDTFIALDDATPIFNISEPVTKGAELWMIVRNGDAVNPHAVSVSAVILGTEA